MRVSDVKGMITATLILEERDSAEFARLDDSEVIARAKAALSVVVPEHLIKDILVAHEGSSLLVAFSI